MRKNVFGRQFKRDTNERKGLFKGLMSALVLEGRIRSTEPKLKSIKGKVEKLVTRTNKEGLTTYNFLQEYLTPEASAKMVAEVAPRFKKRPGGYTRIIKLGKRFADNAPTALIEWVDYQENLDKKIQESQAKKATQETKQTTAKKSEKEKKPEKKVQKRSVKKEGKGKKK